MLKTVHRHTFGLGLALALGLQAPAQAQLQTGPEFLRGGEYLVQINPTDATYDPYEVRRGFQWGVDVPAREGLIDVRIKVNADGSVSDVEVLDGFYSPEFLEEALADIGASTFHPATAGETPIDWPALEMRLILRGPNVPALSATLRPDLEKFGALMSERKFEEAEVLVKDMLANKALLLADYALLQDQLAGVYMGTNRMHEALIAARNATSSSKAVVDEAPGASRLAADMEKFIDDYLVPELYNDALKKRFLLALALNQTGEARNTFGELERRGAIAADDTIRTQHAELNAKLLNGEETVGSQIKLVQGKWIFEVSNRKIFGVTGLQEGGQVDYIDIACGNNKKRRMVFTPDTEFGLPASWENCRLEFHGKADTQFILYEYLM